VSIEIRAIDPGELGARGFDFAVPDGSLQAGGTTQVTVRATHAARRGKCTPGNPRVLSG
jgi:hypothetical protein